MLNALHQSCGRRRRKRFGEHVVVQGLCCPDRGIRRAADNGGGLRWSGRTADRSRHAVAVAAGHVPINDHNIKGGTRHCLKRLDAIRRERDIAAEGLKDHGLDLPMYRVILNDEHRQPGAQRSLAKVRHAAATLSTLCHGPPHSARERSEHRQP